MLIVPAERKLDIRRPPMVTALLLLACVVIFFGYQSGDDARAAAALDVYVEQNLIAWEESLFADWARENGAADYDAADWQMYLALTLSPEFDARVRQQWRNVPPADEWRSARAEFETVRDRVSWIRFGFSPGGFEPRGLVAHMFMHGGWDHLLGNMIFLVIFGIALERVLGPAFFLCTYLVTGLVAAGLFAFTHPGSHAPLVGASGAISGLMGAYLGVYGFRKIRFFYIIGFWFGQLRAPALLLFPLWLLNELYGHFFGDGPVAYMAHAGGLLGGLGIALLLRKHAAKVIGLDEADVQREAARSERVRRIRQLLTDLRLDEAARLAQQSIVGQPNDFAYWQLYREVAERLAPGTEQQRMFATLFANAGNKAMSVEFLRDALKEYGERNAAEQPALTGKSGAALALRFFREGRLHDADALLDTLERKGKLSAEFADLLGMLMQFAEKNRDRRRAERYRRYRASIASAD